MATFTLAELKERAGTLARRSKMGQIVEKDSVALLVDLINTLDKQASLPAPEPRLGPGTERIAEVEAANAEAVSQTVEAAKEALAATSPAEAPKRKRRVKISGTASIAPTVTVGNQPQTAATPEPSKGKAASAAATSVDATPGSRVVSPVRIQRGRGVTVGNQSVISTKATVGSHPGNSAANVTVGGRPRKV